MQVLKRVIIFSIILFTVGYLFIHNKQQYTIYDNNIKPHEKTISTSISHNNDINIYFSTSCHICKHFHKTYLKEFMKKFKKQSNIHLNVIVINKRDHLIQKILEKETNYKTQLKILHIFFDNNTKKIDALINEYKIELKKEEESKAIHKTMQFFEEINLNIMPIFTINDKLVYFHILDFHTICKIVEKNLNKRP